MHGPREQAERFITRCISVVASAEENHVMAIAEGMRHALPIIISGRDLDGVTDDEIRAPPADIVDLFREEVIRARTLRGR